MHLLPFTTRRAVAYPAGSTSPLMLSPLGGPPAQISSIDEAIQGIAPYDIVPGLMSSDYLNEATLRLARYREAWAFYCGDHWDFPYEDGERKPVHNFCKKVVDVAVDWFVAKGWSTVCPSGNEYVADLLNDVWEYNTRLDTTERMANFGAVTGDVFLYITLQTKDEFGEVLPKSEWKVRICPLNPAHVFPRWNPFKPGEMLSCLIQYPFAEPDGSGVMKLLSLDITPKRWTLYYDNNKIRTQPNPLGLVNVVHVPNFILANSCFGQSDIHSIIPLNEDYNILKNQLRRIVKYHAEPTTVIFGAKVSDMEKGAKKVWSGLPVDARVENLMLQSDIPSIRLELTDLKSEIAELSQTPLLLFNSSEKLSISNTSGLAMQMTYQPIIDKTRKRQTTYGNGFTKANEIILRFHEIVLGIDIAALADKPEARYKNKQVFSSPLPRDEKSELDAATQRVNLGIWSKAEAQRRLSDVNDLSRLILECMADERYELAKARSMQRANSGLKPNYAVPFMDSRALGEDFESLAEGMPDPD